MTLSRPILAGLVLSAALLSAHAEACTQLPSLYPRGSPEAIAEEHEHKVGLASEFAEEDLIFVGSVASDRPTNVWEQWFGPRDPEGSSSAMRFWVKPETVLKGNADHPTTSVFAGTHMVACWFGVFPEVGQRVVVHARRVGSGWYGGFEDADFLPYLEPLLR
jgi:hypothetical protein